MGSNFKGHRNVRRHAEFVSRFYIKYLGNFLKYEPQGVGVDGLFNVEDHLVKLTMQHQDIKQIKKIH